MSIRDRKAKLLLTAALGLTTAACGGGPSSESSSNNIEDVAGTPDYHLCALPGEEPLVDLDGAWGEIGIWCDPAAMTEIHPDIENEVINRYPGLIIRHRESPWEYRKEVIAKLVRVMTVVMHVALEERGLRGVWTQDEVNAFTHAYLANAYQESFFSQYKRVDGELRLMRGEKGHAHGLFQVMDYWHGTAVWEQSVSWDLLSNALYGTRFYLDKWELTKEAFAEGRADCVGTGGVVDFHALARSAWAVQNGGNMGKVCRWTDGSDTYAVNDLQYEEKWQLLASSDWGTEFGWVTAYPAAYKGIEHIDFLGILALDALPAGACGDGFVMGQETCDDANALDGDGCSSLCVPEPGFSCGGEPSTCATTCGDGVLSPTEGCDDGNTADGDGCNAGCGLEHGFACQGSPSVCAATCGDGVIAANELCDDGNTDDADGCTACAVDDAYECAGEPSICVPDAPPPPPPGGDPQGEGGGSPEPTEPPDPNDPWTEDDDPGGDSSGWEDDDWDDYDPYDPDEDYEFGEDPTGSQWNGETSDEGGCAFSGTAPRPSNDAGWWAAALGLALARRRRRR